MSDEKEREKLAESARRINIKARIKRAVSKILRDPANSKKAKTAAGLALTQRRKK